MPSLDLVITIDGPAASGKSTVSRELARRLQWRWVSTGAFYRGLAFAALRKDVDLENIQALVALSRSLEWRVEMSPEKTRVVFHDQDVTDLVVHEDVGNFASRISSYPEVRTCLLQNQRDCFVPGQGLIAEGRDCGTVVFPQAFLKIYLTASSEHRAARRAQEQGSNQEDILKAQGLRDHADSSRKAAPLQIPDRAWVLDTTNLVLEEVVTRIESRVQKDRPI